MAKIDCSIDHFLGNFTKDLARPNRYVIYFTMPPGLPNFSGGWFNPESTSGGLRKLQKDFNNNGAMSIACHTCTLPGRALMNYDHVQHSAPFRVPYSQLYRPVTFSFYANSKLDQRHYFDAWQTAVVNINDNSMNFYNEYTAEVRILQLDRGGNETYGVTLFAAYPTSIGDVELAYGTTNAYTNVSVTLEYKLWRSDNDETDVYTN